MGRPPLPIGAWGELTAAEESPGVFRASARYRGADGVTRTYSRRRGSSGAAKRALREALKEMRDAATGDELTRESTVHDLGVMWFEAWKAEKDRPANTRTSYRKALARIEKALYGVRLNEVTTPRLEGFIQGVRKSSPDMARQVRSILSMMMDEAIRLGALDRNPAAATRTVPRVEKDVRSMAFDEVVRLRKAALEYESRERSTSRPWPILPVSAAIDVLLGTGVRPGEMLGLRRVLDFDLSADNPVTVVNGTVVRDEEKPKGEKVYRQSFPKTATSDRILYLPNFTVEALTRHLELSEGADDDPMFPTALGRWMDGSAFAYRFNQVRKAANLTWVTPYTLRKTVATQVYRGQDLKSASQQLGHSEIGVTSKHYVEHDNRGPAEVVSLMDRFIEGPRKGTIISVS